MAGEFAVFGCRCRRRKPNGGIKLKLGLTRCLFDPNLGALSVLLAALNTLPGRSLALQDGKRYELNPDNPERIHFRKVYRRNY